MLSDLIQSCLCNSGQAEGHPRRGSFDHFLRETLTSAFLLQRWTIHHLLQLDHVHQVKASPYWAEGYHGAR